MSEGENSCKLSSNFHTVTCVYSVQPTYKVNKCFVCFNGGLALKSTVCSSRAPKFDFRNPHGGSQPSVIPGLGDPVSSFGFYGYQACTQCTIYIQAKHLQTNKIYLRRMKPHRAATVEELLLKIYFYLCECVYVSFCAPCVCMCPQWLKEGTRSPGIILQVVVSHPVGVGNQSQVLWKNSQCS